MTKCAKCGTMVEDGINFCPTCGDPVGVAAEAAGAVENVQAEAGQVVDNVKSEAEQMAEEAKSAGQTIADQFKEQFGEFKTEAKEVADNAGAMAAGAASAVGAAASDLFGGKQDVPVSQSPELNNTESQAYAQFEQAAQNAGTMPQGTPQADPFAGQAQASAPNPFDSMGAQPQQPFNAAPQNYQSELPVGNDKSMGVVSYITWIGFFVALLAGKQPDGTRTPYLNFHLNQALVLNICSLVLSLLSRFIDNGIISAVLCVVSLALFVFWIMAIIGAAKGETKKVPVVGDITLIK